MVPPGDEEFDDNMDGFDPMKDDFNDVAFNSYRSGPGSYINPSLHTHQGWKNKNENYKLYISRIPLGIKECGFQNIFSNFGVPLKTYLTVASSRKCKYGFVEYRTLREASRAIYSLNNIPPLNLSVKFAITEEAKKNRNEMKFETPLSAMESTQAADTSSFSDKVDESGQGLVSRGRGLPLMAMGGIKPCDLPSMYRRYTPYISTTSLPSNSHPAQEFTHHCGNEIVDCFNQALTFELPVITSDQKYLIHMGRGYSIKNLIDHSERYKNFENKVYSFSNEENKKDCFKHPCTLCRKAAVRVCFNCRKWYCSKICFREDSPNHVVNNSTGIVVCYRVDNTNETSEHNRESLRNSNSDVHKSNGVFIKKLVFPPVEDLTKDQLKLESSDVVLDTPLKPVVANRNSHLVFTHSIFTSDKFNCGNGEELLNEKDANDNSPVNSSVLPPSSDYRLPTDCFSLVKICGRVGDTMCYWVHDMSRLEEVFNIVKSLHSYCQSSQSMNIATLAPSVRCAALVEGFWYRGKVLSCDFRTVKILLVDYGREVDCPIINIKSLPEDKFNMDPLAFKVRFAEGTPNKYQDLTDQDEVRIKPVSMEKDGTLVACIENEVYPSDNNTADSSMTISSANDSSVSTDEDPLPLNTSSEVIVAHVCSKNEFYVNPCSMWDVLTEITEILDFTARKKDPVTNPVLDQFYIKCFQDIWCRTKVVGIDPLKIFYIDYGNEEVIQQYNGDLRVIPPTLLPFRILPMAFKVRFQDGTSQSYLDSIKLSAKLSIKPIFKLGEVYVVSSNDNDGGHSSNRTTEEDLLKSNPKSISDIKTVNHLMFAIKCSDSFVIQVNQFLCSNRISGSLNLNPKYNHLTVKEIEKIINQSSSNQLEKVEAGDSVACLSREGLIGRGCVLKCGQTKTTNKVALVDLGYVCWPDRLAPLPKSLKSIPQAAVYCTFKSPQSHLKVGSLIRCKCVGEFKSEESSELECEGDTVGDCLVTCWKSRVEDAGLTCLNIESSYKVSLMSFYSPQALYLRPRSPRFDEIFLTLLQDVAAFASSAPVLEREPEIGEVIACLFTEDQNFYRAQVYRKLGDLYSVIFLDFGNTHDVERKDMRSLSDSLKMVPCCAVKVGLKGVTESILTAKAINYLNLKSIAAKEFLFVEYDDSLDECTLKTKEGESVNNRISEFISPHWKKCLDQGVDPTNGEVFFGSDVKYLKWSSGQNVNLVLITRHCANSYLVMNCEDGLLEFMRECYTSMVSQYCSSFSKHYQYVPRLRELCFVKMPNGEQWYRAVCTHTYNVTCWVVLIDFGNTGEIHFKNIRPMTYEFMQFPSILKKCYIHGLSEMYPNDLVKDSLEKILKVGSTHTAVVIKEEDFGVVHIHLPEIVEIASKLGLPSIKVPSLTNST